MSLTVDQILGARDYEVTKCEVPEWGGDVYIRTMSTKTRSWWEQEVLKSKAKGGNGLFPNFRAELLVRVLCDQNGTLLFKPDQAEALGERSGDVVARLFDKAFAIGQITEEDVVEQGKS